MRTLWSYAFVFLAIVFVVYGQLVIKWQVNQAGELPADSVGHFAFATRLLTNPWILSALFAAFCAAILYMFALSRLQLSHAYPFFSLSFVFVLFLSSVLLGEPLAWQKIAGIVIIIVGVSVGSQG